MSISASQVRAPGQDRSRHLDCRKAWPRTTATSTRPTGCAPRHRQGREGHRAATEGTVYSYIHGGGKLGVLLEVNCETDFVARGDDFQKFVHDVAMHIAAAGPLWVNEDDADPVTLEREKAIAKQQAIESGKPENIAEKMVTGKIKNTSPRTR